MTTITDFVISAGVVAIPLLAFSVLAVALIAERIIFWWRLSHRQRPLVGEILRLYPDNLPAVVERLKRNLDLPIARIFLEALSLDQPTPDEFQLALETSAKAELPLLKRSSLVFDTIVSLSPLLGLLGTVLGLIRSFSSLRLGEVAGMAESTGVTSGISESLASTALGLIVAIGTLLFANLFRGLYQRQIALIQEYGGQLELKYRRQVLALSLTRFTAQ